MQNILDRRPWRHGVVAAAAAGCFLIGGTLVTAAQAPARTVPAPGFSSISGVLNLSEEHRQRIREWMERDKPEVQPVPQAFAPAVGMTTPPELRLAKLPDELRDLPGITEVHQYVLLDTGLLMIVGDRRLVTALIAPLKRPLPSRAP
jgi:hypothetical protein